MSKRNVNIKITVANDEISDAEEKEVELAKAIMGDQIWTYTVKER